MAQGTGIPGLEGPSNFATLQSGPSAAAAGMPFSASADAFNKVAADFGGVSDMMDAHQQVVDQANLARTQSGVENSLSTIAGQNQDDPAGFRAAAAQAKGDFVGAQPGRYAIQASQMWDLNSDAQWRQIGQATFAKNHVLAGAGIQDDIKSANATIQSEIATGANLSDAINQPTVQAAMARRSADYDALVAGHFIDSETRAYATQQDASLDKTAAYKGFILAVRATHGPQAAWAELARFHDAGTQAMAAANAPSPQAPAATVAPGSGGDAPSTGAAPAVVTSNAAPAAASSDGAIAAGGPTQAQAAAARQPTPFEAGINLTPAEWAAMRAGGVDALTGADSQAMQLVRAQNAQHEADQRTLSTRMAAESDYQLHYGQASGQGPTDAEVMSTFGGDKLTEFTKQKTAAIIQHVEDGITPDMTGDQIAARAAQKAALKPLDINLDTPDKLAGGERAILMAEHGVDAQGAPLRSGAGAVGTYQLEPSTALAIAKAHGLTQYAGMTPTQMSAALGAPDQQANKTLGHLLYSDLTAKYGDLPEVAFAYHNGASYDATGNVQSAPVERMRELYGPPGVQMPLDQWLDKAATTSLPGSPNGAPVGAKYVSDVSKYVHVGQQTADAAATVQRANQVTAEAIRDPVGFGRNHGWGTSAPFDPMGFAGNAQAQQQFTAGLTQRQAQGATIASQHPGVPAKMLSAAESASYSDLLARNPSAAVPLGNAVTNALGGDGAREFFREIGTNAGQSNVGLQAASLVASGPFGARFAGDVMDGLDAQKRGAKPAPMPKLNGRTAEWSDYQAQVAPAFALMPVGALPAVMDTAQTAYLGQSQHGTPASPTINLRAALGGAANPTTGENFGGVDSVNGRPAVIPTWLKSGTFGTAVKDIAVSGRLGGDGPVYANGQPMRAPDLAGMWPQLTPDGNYVLRDLRTNQLARTRSGASYRLDLEANKAFLASRGGMVAQDR